KDKQDVSVDIRSADEYNGKIFAPNGVPESAVRAGHVPGAVNVTWSKSVAEDGTFKSADESRAIYQAVGVDGSKPIITYCRIGERSSHSWFASRKSSGYDVRNYDGSWTEYGNSVGSPISNPASGNSAPPAGSAAAVATSSAAAIPSAAAAIGNAAAVASSAAIGAAAWWSASQPEGGRGSSLSSSLGAAFGIVSQRSRFCFYCIARDAIERRDPAGAYAVSVASAVGTLGYHAVFGAFSPIPGAERSPPGAHIGPVSSASVAGAFVFGVGMRISGSCISAHLYRLGEGASASPFALSGAGVGFVSGFAS
ncbi:hypothetical protein OY671_008123, partial [Metschnikowia pulcherrima]